MNTINNLENFILALATKIGLWITPLVPAYFVHRAMIKNLDTPIIWAWIGAAALEIVGLGATKNLLRAYTWNQERRKSDPAAPITWNIVAASIYYLTAFLLVLLIEFIPSTVRFAPAAFVILSGTAALVIALSADHTRRQNLVSERSAIRSTKRQPTSPRGGETGQQPDIDRLQAGRKRQQHLAEQRLADFLADNPNATHAQAADHVGRSRPWVTGKINHWQQTGRLAKNGAGIEITSSPLGGTKRGRDPQ
jgi:hypothetical protein